MREILPQIMPVVILFMLGIFLRRINFLEKEHADLFLKVAIYVSLPALIIPSFAKIPLSFTLLYLPLIAIIIMLILGTIGFMVSKLFSLSEQTKGTFIMSTMIMNLSFVLVFFLAIADPNDIAYFLLFNFGHNILLFTFVYWIACKYGRRKAGKNESADPPWKKLLSLPPLWAMVSGLLINLTKTNIPVVLDATFSLLGNILIPLVTIALGVHFSMKIKRPALLGSSMLIRMAGGFTLGVFFVWLFSLEGIARFAVLMGSVAPVGFNTLVFSSVENLDKDLAAQLVSITLLLGLFVLPIILYFIS
jgi:malate permease and related proteins